MILFDDKAPLVNYLLDYGFERNEINRSVSHLNKPGKNEFYTNISEVENDNLLELRVEIISFLEKYRNWDIWKVSNDEFLVESPAPEHEYLYYYKTIENSNVYLYIDRLIAFIRNKKTKGK